MCWASCQPLYREYTRVPWKHYFIYRRPPAETYKGELQKSFTILTTTCKKHFTTRKRWIAKFWAGFFWSVLLIATRICFFIYQTRASFLLGASYCIIPHTEIIKDVDQETLGPLNCSSAKNPQEKFIIEKKYEHCSRVQCSYRQTILSGSDRNCFFIWRLEIWKFSIKCCDSLLRRPVFLPPSL